MAVLLRVYEPADSITGGLGNDLETITAHWPPVAGHIHHFFAGRGLFVTVGTYSQAAGPPVHMGDNDR
jgi:hypothetical protein